MAHNEFRETATAVSRRAIGNRSYLRSLLAQTRARELDSMEADLEKLKAMKGTREERSRAWYDSWLSVQSAQLRYESASEAERRLRSRGY